ncbi:O-methyltransferase MdmC-like [Mytilus trossulus]|uniref:O-methyltransferase MdmC-like n=1 Tax=Mytilus trossulus TaxID=6551 RepID=UPI003006E747
MSGSHHHDPAVRKLREVITLAKSMNVPETVISGLENVDELMKKRDDYCDQKTSGPSEAMVALIKDTLEHPWKRLFNEKKTKWDINPVMLSGNLEGYVLKFLVNASKAKKVLEVGLFTGCSALGMAEVMPNDGKVVTCEFDPYLANLARTFMDRSSHGKKVEIIIGSALDTIKDLAKRGEKFDFIFIDADRPGKSEYFHIALEKLLAPGGTIALDNALSGGRSYMTDTSDDDGIKDVNETIATREDIYHVLLPVRDGIMLVRRKTDMD